MIYGEHDTRELETGKRTVLSNAADVARACIIGSKVFVPYPEYEIVLIYERILPVIMNFSYA